jgi:group I intron endonuclease
MKNILEWPNEAGIYKLTCNVNNKVYIGKTVCFRQRINFHKNSYKKSSVISLLRNAIIKYGWDNFNIEIIETFKNFDKLEDNNSLLEREKYYISLYDSTNKDKGYNLCKFSNDRTGIPLSQDAKLKLSEFNKGKKLSNETKQKISESKRGKKFSNEHKKKLSDSRLLNPMSEEHKEKLRQSNIGKKMSDITKNKLRLALTGRKVSEETRKKLSRPCSEETKEKLRQANLGKKHTPESIEKMRLVKLGKPRNKTKQEETQ